MKTMKKFFCLLMLFCSLTIFAATNATGDYTGTLNVAVGGSPSDPVSNQNVNVTINGGIATLIISEF